MQTPRPATFASATTLTSTGAVDSFHDSYTALGGMVPIANMMLGEVAPGGTGSGLYGMLVLAVITVFVAGLMVGRTPEYVGKKIQAREIKFASLYFLVTPILVLVGTAAAMASSSARASMLVLGLAGSLAGQGQSPATAGTLRTHHPLFVGMLAGVTIILVALTFLPALALGPLAEGL